MMTSVRAFFAKYTRQWFFEVNIWLNLTPGILSLWRLLHLPKRPHEKPWRLSMSNSALVNPFVGVISSFIHLSLSVGSYSTTLLASGVYWHVTHGWLSQTSSAINSWESIYENRSFVSFLMDRIVADWTSGAFCVHFISATTFELFDPPIDEFLKGELRLHAVHICLGRWICLFSNFRGLKEGCTSFLVELMLDKTTHMTK